MDEIDEVLHRIEQQKEEHTLPEGIMALPLLQMAYRGKVKLTPQQARCAIEALPYETPKLSAAAIGLFDGQSFAEALDRCIQRSQQPAPLLNSPTEQLPTSVASKPFARPNYRRF
jgi:hypothetical protein